MTLCSLLLTQWNSIIFANYFASSSGEWDTFVTEQLMDWCLRCSRIQPEAEGENVRGTHLIYLTPVTNEL